MYLEATCIDLTSEKIENILRNSKPINYKWLIGRIRKQIPSLYEKLIIEIDVEVPLSPTEVLMQLNYISEK